MPAARNLEKISFYSSLLSVTGLVAMLLLSQIPLNVRIGGCFLIALWVIKNYPAIGATLSALGCGQQAAISGLNIAACLIMGGAAVHDIITLPYASAALWCKLAANILWLSIALNTKHEPLLNTMAAMVFLIMTVLLHDPLLVYIGVTGLMAASAGWAALSTK